MAVFVLGMSHPASAAVHFFSHTSLPAKDGAVKVRAPDGRPTTSRCRATTTWPVRGIPHKFGRPGPVRCGEMGGVAAFVIWHNTSAAGHPCLVRPPLHGSVRPLLLAPPACHT